MEKNNLPQEIIEDERSGSVLRLFLLTVFFLFVFNALFYLYLQINNPNLGYVINARKWRLLENLEEKQDWLILGDSSCNQGFSPAAFESILGASAINLCTIADMLTVGDSWMLERHIKKFGPPKNVLLIHTYNAWHRNDMDLGLASQLPAMLLIRENPNPQVLTKKDLATILFYKYVPLYSQKSSLQKILFALFHKSQQDISFDEKGFMLMENSDFDSVSASKESHLSFLAKTDFQISANNLLGLENIRGLAEKYGFDVYVANGPLNSDIAEDPSFQAYHEDISSFIKNFAKNSERVHYLDNIYSFEDDQMVSSDHIIADAAQEYSKKISESIEKELCSQR